MTEWNITVGHRSLTDQLVLTDHNFALIRHTYMIGQGVIVIAWILGDQ